MVFLGFVEFTASGLSSFIALAPTLLGLPLAVLGFFTLPRGRMGRPALLLAALLALAGVVLSLNGFSDLSKLYNGEPVPYPMVGIAGTFVALLFAVYLIAAVAALARGQKRTQE
jgi:hypothetical protein